METSDQNIQQNAPNCTIFQKFFGGTCPEHLCNAQHAVLRHAYIHFWKNYLHASVKSCNVCAFIAFWKKMTINKVFERSTSIYKSSHALVVPIVLQKHQFHGICEFSKKKQAISRVHSKSLILRATNPHQKNITHPKAAKLATLGM